jgi:hypothetical protein
MPTTTAARVTATGASSQGGLVAALAAVAAAAIVGCGSAPNQAVRPTASNAGALARLQPESAPAAWRRARLPAGEATLAFPKSWSSIRSDPGTVSAATKSRGGQIVGYLNATPQQGDETLADWSSFRPAHDADEGDRNVSLRAAATGVPFRNGRGSCVIDDYTTSTQRRYRELACIVSGTRSTSVVVGAAPPSRWHRSGPVIERSVEGFVS